MKQTILILSLLMGSIKAQVDSTAWRELQMQTSQFKTESRLGTGFMFAGGVGIASGIAVAQSGDEWGAPLAVTGGFLFLFGAGLHLLAPENFEPIPSGFGIKLGR